MNAFCFLTATPLLFPGLDMSLRRSPRFMSFVDIEFTSNVDSESWSAAGTSGSLSSDNEVSEISSARS